MIRLLMVLMLINFILSYAHQKISRILYSLIICLLAVNINSYIIIVTIKLQFMILLESILSLFIMSYYQCSSARLLIPSISSNFVTILLTLLANSWFKLAHASLIDICVKMALSGDHLRLINLA